MDSIYTRYGENVTLSLDTGDPTLVSADLYVGMPGETYIITSHATLTDGVGTFELSTTDMSVPLGKYFYQVNVTDELGAVSKYPSPQRDCTGCSDVDFPQFIVDEALDQIEVS